MKAFLLSLLIGVVIVIQGALNRRVMDSWGLSFTILLNGVLFFVFCVGFFYLVKIFPDFFPKNFASTQNSFKFVWWYFIPAFCGFLIVALIPWVIPKLGALRAFLAIVVGQMVFSLFWDSYFENISFSFGRILGAVLAVLGLLVSNW